MPVSVCKNFNKRSPFIFESKVENVHFWQHQHFRHQKVTFDELYGTFSEKIFELNLQTSQSMNRLTKTSLSRN